MEAGDLALRAVARRGDAGFLAFDTGLEAGVADLVAAALGFTGVAFAATGLATGRGFPTLGFLADFGESACTAGLPICFTGDDAFGW